MADRGFLKLAGLALLGAAGVMALTQSSGGDAPSPSPTPPPPAPQPKTGGGCVLAAGKTSPIVLMAAFYNWTDLRRLPLNPSDPQDWNHGGTFAAIGIGPGYGLPWTEAKVGAADDGTSGWFLRISDRSYNPGDWAVPATALGIANPCG